MPNDLTPPDPSIVLELLEAFRCSKVMFAAVSMGIFDRLETKPQSATGLARDLPADPDALTRLLDACVGLKLLERRGNSYANTPTASAYLCGTSPRRITGYINFSNDFLWQLWGQLEGAVREGTNRWKPVFGWDGPLFSNFFRTEESKREFLLAMHGYGLIRSPLVVAAFDLSRFKRLVDLGGATGHLAIAACQRYPQLLGVVFDLPEAASLAHEIVDGSNVADRIRIVSGDFFSDSLPEADLFALGRILHDWTETKILTLLEKIHERLPTGGGILIAEKLLLDDKSGPQWAHLQSLSMLVCTEGKERTLAEYEALLHRTGFGQVQGLRTNSPLDAVLAIKQ
ncbi:MAG: homocysteine methyltransferase [Planctomycetaceae bacterium]|nr:homocysteine methyltransferase [Planctomycetaceae bacterium]